MKGGRSRLQKHGHVWKVAVCFSVTWLLWTPGALSQQDTVREYQFKAAFLFNLIKFVRWPDSSFVDGAAPFCLGIVGKDPFHEDLADAVAGRSVQDRRLEVRKFAGTADVSELEQCHLLFISLAAQSRANELVKSLEGASVLTVAEWETFTESGGMLELFVVDNKLAFEVNASAAKTAGLEISSQLLKLARVIQ